MIFFFHFIVQLLFLETIFIVQWFSFTGGCKHKFGRAFKETYQVVGADRLGRGRHLPGVGRERRRPGRARVIGDVGSVGRVASPSSRPALDLGLGTDAGLGGVVVLLVDVHLHLLFLQNSGQKRSVSARRRRLQRSAQESCVK